MTDTATPSGGISRVGGQSDAGRASLSRHIEKLRSPLPLHTLALAEPAWVTVLLERAQALPAFVDFHPLETAALVVPGASGPERSDADPADRQAATHLDSSQLRNPPAGGATAPVREHAHPRTGRALDRPGRAMVSKPAAVTAQTPAQPAAIQAGEHSAPPSNVRPLRDTADTGRPPRVQNARQLTTPPGSDRQLGAALRQLERLLQQIGDHQDPSLPTAQGSTTRAPANGGAAERPPRTAAGRPEPTAATRDVNGVLRSASQIAADQAHSVGARATQRSPSTAIASHSAASTTTPTSPGSAIQPPLQVLSTLLSWYWQARDTPRPVALEHVRATTDEPTDGDPLKRRPTSPAGATPAFPDAVGPLDATGTGSGSHTSNETLADRVNEALREQAWLRGVRLQ